MHVPHAAQLWKCRFLPGHTRSRRSLRYSPDPENAVLCGSKPCFKGPVYVLSNSKVGSRPGITSSDGCQGNIAKQGRGGWKGSDRLTATSWRRTLTVDKNSKCCIIMPHVSTGGVRHATNGDRAGLGRLGARFGWPRLPKREPSTNKLLSAIPNIVIHVIMMQFGACDTPPR